MPKVGTSQQNGKKWEVRHGPDVSDILLAVMSPRRDLEFKIVLYDLETKQRHPLTIAVNRIWGGSDMDSVGAWDAMVGFEGTTPSVFLAECPNLIAQVAVYFTVGKEIGRLTIVNLTSPPN